MSVSLLWLFARSWGADLTENDAPTGFDRRAFLVMARAVTAVASAVVGTVSPVLLGAATGSLAGHPERPQAPRRRLDGDFGSSRC